MQTYQTILWLLRNFYRSSFDQIISNSSDIILKANPPGKLFVLCSSAIGERRIKSGKMACARGKKLRKKCISDMAEIYSYI